jgi:hypothetical protein
VDFLRDETGNKKNIPYRPGGMAQAVECLVSAKTPSSKPQYCPSKKNTP